MVMGYKNGTLTEAQYTEQYMKILDAVPRDAWKWLYEQAVNDELTLLCYCRDGWFCHTHLLIDYACQKYPQAFSKK